MSKERPIILVDMDGVLADFNKAASDSLPPRPRKNFYIADDYSDQPELRQQVIAKYNTPGFFEDLESLPHIHEGWQTLIDNGYEPRIASAPITSNRTSIEGKVRWLERVMVPEFGAGVVTNAIIDKDKWKYPGLALIDDRPNISRGPSNDNQAEWDHVLFGWEQWKDADLSVLAKTAFRLLRWKDTDSLLSTLDTIQSLRK